MSNRLLAGVAVAGLMATASVMATPASAYGRPGTTERISVSSGGAQAKGDSSTTATYPEIAITPDARYVAFTSSATNLVPGYGNASGEVYLRDRKSHTTRIASLATPLVGVTSPAQCAVAGAPSVSDDGRYVAFAGACQLPTDLVALPMRDVYVRDMKAGTTIRVSVTPNGDRQTLGFSSDDPVVSGNGQIVVFTSTASNLVAQPTCATNLGGLAACGQENVYVRNLKTQVTTLVSATSGGDVANGSSTSPSISADGRYVAFTSSASNLSPNDVNFCTDLSIPSCPDVYLRDLKTNTVELISIGLNGGTGLSRSGATGLDIPEGISANGRYVAFRSSTGGLVPNTPPNYTGIYVRDRLLHRTERESVDSDGTPLALGNGTFGLDRSGRYVVFDNVETALKACAGRVTLDAVHDRATGATAPVLPCALGADAIDPQIASGGRYVAFSSSAANLVPNDTNKKSDIFVRDRGAALGVGGVGRVTLAGGSSSGLLRAADAAGDVGAGADDIGLDLRAVTVAYRPETADLFVRVDVDHMPEYTLASPTVVYTVDMTVGGDRYELRMGKSAVGPSFALFRANRVGWSPIADLHGGYGTTGEAVVAAVPLAVFGARNGARVTDVRAASGFGSGVAGIVETMDSVTL